MSMDDSNDSNFQGLNVIERLGANGEVIEEDFEHLERYVTI